MESMYREPVVGLNARVAREASCLVEMASMQGRFDYKVQRQVMGKKANRSRVDVDFSDVLVRVDPAHALDLSAQPLARVAPSPELEARSERSDQVGFWQSRTYLEESTRADAPKASPCALWMDLH